MSSTFALPSDAITLGPLVIGAAVLAAAGLAKLVRPNDTARALKAAGIGGGAPLVRVLSAFEIAVAVSAAGWAHPVAAALVAVSYLAFAGFVAYALRRGTPLATCGCFGEPDSPPTVVHVVLNVLLAAAAIAATVSRPPGLTQLFADHRAGTAALFGAALVAAALVIVAMTELPRTQLQARQTALAVLGHEHISRRSRR
ncbi:MAG: MauE/DoxX family redox-associated membrane protein [Acidimicrobiia bacterium]